MKKDGGFESAVFLAISGDIDVPRCLWQKEADQLIIFVNGQEQDIQVQGGTGKIFSHIIELIIDVVNIFIDVVCDTESRLSTAMS